MTTESNGATAASQADRQPTICYESYLLRLRRVTGLAGERRQIYLQCICDGEVCYFNSLRELTTYLCTRGDGGTRPAARPSTDVAANRPHKEETDE